ncbi:MAG TPA: tRNA(Ile)(2)-agmatinylcytidine synthase [Candidatus Acidoferrales bacterium]|nr:tRNA(Ile)(2)-agmatinylcytidine synthase [Candidatus Acidoferrales bacterium]
MIIGIDDTDSKNGGCTTYLAALLKNNLEVQLGTRITARLIRLNPTIKYKTRGNASVGLKIKGNYDVIDVVRDHIKKMAHFYDENTNPGAVILESDDLPHDIKQFSTEAMVSTLSIQQAAQLIERHDLGFVSFKNGRGLIGALAAVGADLEADRTYELIAYRYTQNFGKKRYVNRDSVFKSDVMTYPFTWDTVDRSSNCVVFSPHSPDPILYGIRGDNPTKILTAQSLLISEPFEHMVIFETNQGTDAHIRKMSVEDLREGESYRVFGVVDKEPWTIKGGHTFFSIKEENSLLCAAFEPTGAFREVIRQLKIGDKVYVYGSYVNDCLNLEKLRIVDLVDVYERANPTCCGKRMKSMGKDQGIRCEKCGIITDKSHVHLFKIKRNLGLGFYEGPPSARRHLSKPVIRLRGAGNYIHPSR